MILINGVKFNDTEFHNGEVIFEKPKEVRDDVNIIELKFQDNRDIANLMFLVKYLNSVTYANKDLYMEYCPYERMDREINNQIFSMKYFAQIIGNMNFRFIYILDPHSQVCVNELKKACESSTIVELDLEVIIEKVINLFKPDYICYPDKGARAKYTEVLSNIKIPCFYGSKKRDLENQGRIMEYELVDAPELKDKKVLIIDDICCLGGTAYNAAVEMKKLGAKEVAFYISHCENGIFAGKILEPSAIVNEPTEHGKFIIRKKYTIDKVYTADTMNLKQSHDNITIIK